MNSKFKIILGLLVAGALGFFLFTGGDSNDTANAVGSNNTYGKLDSQVTLTEFVDFQCEACYAYYPYVKQVKELYKDRVRFEIRHFPISSGHQFAIQAARTAEAAARQGKFWEMHDKIFEGQKQWEQTSNPQSYFDRYAEEIGLNMEQFQTDFKSSEVMSMINKDLADVKALGGTGTPTFLLNGERLDPNPQPTVESISQVLDEALAKAAGNQSQ